MLSTLCQPLKSAKVSQGGETEEEKEKGRKERGREREKDGGQVSSSPFLSSPRFLLSFLHPPFFLPFISPFKRCLPDLEPSRKYIRGLYREWNNNDALEFDVSTTLRFESKKSSAFIPRICMHAAFCNWPILLVVVTHQVAQWNEGRRFNEIEGDIVCFMI